jgi:hypothetical protein
MVASLTLNDMAVIKAIGAYNGENILVMKTMAVSPGKPICEKRGSRNTANLLNNPEYWRRRTNNETGKMIFNSQTHVFPALGKAFLTHAHILLIVWFIAIF